MAQILQHWHNIRKHTEAGTTPKLKEGGNQKCRVRKAGSSDPPVPCTIQESATVKGMVLKQFSK